MPSQFKKRDRVLYRGDRATVQKQVGGTDYIILTDSGKKLIVPERKLVLFEEIPDEPEVMSSMDEVETEEELKQAVEEAKAGSESEVPESEAEGKPQLTSKKFAAMSKAELYNLAKVYELPGRSKMDEAALRSALVNVLDIVD